MKTNFRNLFKWTHEFIPLCSNPLEILLATHLISITTLSQFINCTYIYNFFFWPWYKILCLLVLFIKNQWMTKNHGYCFKMSGNVYELMLIYVLITIFFLILSFLPWYWNKFTSSKKWHKLCIIYKFTFLIVFKISRQSLSFKWSSVTIVSITSVCKSIVILYLCELS